jgi:hypothetical protein
MRQPIGKRSCIDMYVSTYAHPTPSVSFRTEGHNVLTRLAPGGTTMDVNDTEFTRQPVFAPQGVVTEPTRLFARDGVSHALSRHGDSGATSATVLRPPRHRSPRATEDGSGMANPGCHGSMHHGSEPPRSKLAQTWYIDHEAHLLQSRVIVNSIPQKTDTLRRSLNVS